MPVGADLSGVKALGQYTQPASSNSRKRTNTTDATTASTNAVPNLDSIAAVNVNEKVSRKKRTSSDYPGSTNNQATTTTAQNPNKPSSRELRGSSVGPPNSSSGPVVNNSKNSEKS